MADRQTTPFEYPEIYNFPPFFTRQPTEETWKEQRRLWCDLILAFYRHEKRFSMTLGEDINHPPFTNKGIRRGLRVDVLREIIDELVKQDNAVWTGSKGSKDSCIIYWRRPEDWANMIHQWAVGSGLTNTVLTVFELTNGDETLGQEFRVLDPPMMRKSLDILQAQAKAQLFAGSSDDEIGIKFYP